MIKSKNILTLAALALTGALLGLSGTAMAQSPEAPSDVFATLQAGTATNAAPDSATVTWIDPDASITSYTFLRATNASGPYTTIATNIAPTSLASVALGGVCDGTNILFYTDTNVVLGVEYYYYEVVAINGSGSTTSSVAAVTFGQGNKLLNAGFAADFGNANGGQEGPAGIGNVGLDVVRDWDVAGDNNGQYGFMNATGSYYNGAGTPCDSNTYAYVLFNSPQMAKLWPTPNPGFFKQTVAAPGGTWSGGGWTFASHPDLLYPPNTFYYEIDFNDGGGNLLAAYESFVFQGTTNCWQTTPFCLDDWNYLAVTNEMQIMDGTNSGVVIANTGPLGVITAPNNTASVTFSANVTGTAGGSVFFDDLVLDEIVAPTLTLPVISGVSPTGILFATNTNFTATITSGDSTIANVQVVLTTSSLGGTAATVTNPAGMVVTGLNTASANVTLPLTANVIYGVTVTGTDGFGLANLTDATFDTLTPTLVIEGADFNFSGGSFLDTPANGGLGLFYSETGEQGVDENWIRNGASPANDSYRSSDNVTIEPGAPNNGEEQKFATAAIEFGTNLDSWDVPQEIGYSGTGDWLNYTRTYGSASTNSAPAGLYNVYADLAYGGGGASAVDLYQVTGDITSPVNQVSNLIGSFTVNNTGGWNTYTYTPLRNAFGSNVAEVALSGQATLRLQATGNTPNIGFIFLVPATVGQAPATAAEYPDGVLPYEPTDAFTFTLNAGFAANGTAATLTGSDVDITLNGVNVTSSASFSSTPNGISGSVPVTYEGQYTAVITATNSAGLVSVSTVTFLNLNPSDYSVEFSDYDFSTNTGSGWVSGLFIDDAVPSGDTANELAPPIYDGEIATNSYFYYPTGFTPGGVATGVIGTPTIDALGIGAIALQGVDIHYPENGQTGANAIYYREDKNTSVSNNNNVGIQPSGDVTDGYRPKYLNARSFLTDPNIGSFNLGYCPAGGWLNYTRTFPTNNFTLWGRFANGSGGGFVNTLSMVTSGVGTTNQTLQALGTFSGNPTGGWTTYAWFPLRDTNGNVANVSLGGKATLRLTLTAPNDNPLFVQFAPAPLQFTLTASLAAGQLNISFPTALGHTYKVLYTASLSPASWAQVGSTITGDGAVQVATESLSSPQGFYTVTMQ
jgi:Carbohydrate binding module (family 6)